ncbi:MarR family winged helix-turn-helix transcriptional regulator [Celeribacter sp. ULVN23_4]
MIRRLNQISMSVFTEQMKSHGQTMTSVQFAALNAIRAHPGIEQARLAGMIAYDRATIGGVLDRLEAKGMIHRNICAKDRRARLVSLTEVGETMLDELIPVVRQFQDEILSGLTSEERKEFLRLAAKAAEGGNHLSRAPLILEKKP